MTQRIVLIQVIFFAIAFSFPKIGLAGKFANQFTEFELPPQWQCNLEGAEWICQSTNESKKKDAVIVLAAKLKGDQDSLDQYLAYLKASKNYINVLGKPAKSDPKYAKTVNINSQAWVDALHMESEIPGFYTRYLATVKQDIGVLITYSIHKTKYQQYLQDFDNMVKTLKVFRKTGGINAAPSNGNLFQNTQIPVNIANDTIFPTTQIQGAADNKPARPADQKLPWPILLGGAAVIGFIVWKKRKNNLN